VRKPDVIATKTALRRGEITKHRKPETTVSNADDVKCPEDFLFAAENGINHRDHREFKEKRINHGGR